MNDYMLINDNNNDNTYVCMNIYIHESPIYERLLYLLDV